MADGDPIQQPGLIYFRPGEALVLLEREELPGDADDLSDEQLNGALENHFRNEGFELHQRSAFRDSSERNERLPVRFGDSPGAKALRIIHTVNLGAWAPAAQRNVESLRQPTLDVGRACAHFNDPQAPSERRQIGPYRLTVTPNWIIAPFQF